MSTDLKGPLPREMVPLPRARLPLQWADDDLVGISFLLV
jgi:hypothetical protein